MFQCAFLPDCRPKESSKRSVRRKINCTESGKSRSSYPSFFVLQNKAKRDRSKTRQGFNAVFHSPVAPRRALFTSFAPPARGWRQTCRAKAGRLNLTAIRLQDFSDRLKASLIQFSTNSCKSALQRTGLGAAACSKRSTSQVNHSVRSPALPLRSNSIPDQTLRYQVCNGTII